MKTGLLISLVLMLSSLTRKATGQQNKPYDHMLLTQTWPMTFCSNHVCEFKPLPNNKFVLHGLWPVDEKGLGIKCDPVNTDWWEVIKASNTRLNDMLTYWPNLLTNDRGKKQCTLWNYEWRKHGVCGNDNGLNYFNKAIKLRKQVDIFEVLSGEGIEPSGSYPLMKMKNAIRNNLSHDIAINCARNNGNYLISEVVLCYDKKGGTQISCNSEEVQRSDASCGNGQVKINYPQSSMATTLNFTKT